MRITFDDTVNKKDWLHRCLLSSLTAEAIDSGMPERAYEVKLLVNNLELEPHILKDLIENIEKHIDNEAKLLADNILTEALEKARKLESLVEIAGEKIREEFNITQQDINYH